MSDDYFRGYREGAKDKQDALVKLLEKWRPDSSWRAYEVQRAAAEIARAGKLPGSNA